MVKSKSTRWDVFIRIFFIVCTLSLFLPWFTYNASIMGYRFGFTFIKLFAIPLLVIGVYLFVPKANKTLLVAAEFGAAANLAVLVAAFGLWQEICNIKGGFQLLDGLHTALPGFWISALLFSLFFLLFQGEFWKRLE